VRLLTAAAERIDQDSVLELAEAIGSGRLSMAIAAAETAWARGDQTAMASAANDLMRLTPTETSLNQALIVDRNRSLAKRLAELSQESSLIAGIGFMHFFGKGSLLEEFGNVGVSTRYLELS
jgi:uncharacterized protein YbaP (TraB family)